MDPNATLNLIGRAVNAGYFDDANDHAENLSEWTRNGGYWPDSDEGRRLACFITDTGEPLEGLEFLAWLVRCYG